MCFPFSEKNANLVEQWRAASENRIVGVFLRFLIVVHKQSD